ncbi:LacI family DNA-binding transcriptional regulator [Paenibacillus cymbidii]|uniref:LacI family DNA-binding transcriptional regulator n=1 Tax=Paenibacillus cymbidii TaxID=1639034 RepID=UPI001080B0E5|nr:LacI family DNA-binding transcriptional regulator [Paenibacillus cymbidii]
MDKKSKVTIKDVAIRAGVGVGTVSRAINGSHAINPETKKKVLDSIQELGYVPDPVAQSMRSGKYKSVAYFVNDISNMALANVAKGMQDYLERMGYTLILYNTGDADLTEKVRSVIQGRKLDGIVLSIPRENDEELNALLAETNLPIVTIDRQLPGIPAGVLTDYTSGVKEAVRYLLSLGHRGIVLLTGTRHILPTRLITQSFTEAFAEAGLSCGDDAVMEGEFTIEFGRRAVQALLPQIRSKRKTAIMTLNNNIFKGVLQTTREHGIEYPQDISLISGEDSDLSQFLMPAVTIISRPLTEIGQNVAKYLVRYISDPVAGKTAAPFRMETGLIVRDSCRAVALP